MGMEILREAEPKSSRYIKRWNSSQKTKLNHAQCQAKTWSRCVAGSITATHDFEVTNFSLLDGIGTGKFLTSSTFGVGGREWNIRLYPDGYKHEDYVGVFLCFLEGPVGARVKYSSSVFWAKRCNDSFTIRCVLAARSSVFEAELFGPMMKNDPTQHIKIEDIEPSIFEALLHFIYTDSLPVDYEDIGNVTMQHLLVAVDWTGCG
ncbi:hypothetical protein PR202_gb14321 [Eleusine coracana subsp. coracana]|uniref:Uncharacterized protein n=1 Tax=Eleusine coracana subsp. coracana TaxID=191504 RepID=A0AAV5ESV6_ELECO|nr:hypothetical protein PR202_gb14321 [Eleusine coracana subsp. coracana]